MMQMRIYLVYPGENKSGELTSNGIWQLESLVRKLSNDKIKVDRIYVNGNNVSKQTGKILSTSLKIPVISDERFVELSKNVILGQVNEGDIQNLDNVYLFADEILKKGNDVIITIGGGIHRALISRLTGMALYETRYFTFLPASVSILDYTSKDGTGKWRMTSLNDRNHFGVP